MDKLDDIMNQIPAETEQEGNKPVAQESKPEETQKEVPGEVVGRVQELAASIVEMAQSEGSEKFVLDKQIEELQQQSPGVSPSQIKKLLLRGIAEELKSNRKAFEETLNRQLSEQIQTSAAGATIETDVYSKELDRLKEVEKKLKPLVDSLIDSLKGQKGGSTEATG